MKSSMDGIIMFALRVVTLGVEKGLTKELMATCFTDE